MTQNAKSCKNLQLKPAFQVIQQIRASRWADKPISQVRLLVNTAFVVFRDLGSGLHLHFYPGPHRYSGQASGTILTLLGM